MLRPVLAEVDVNGNVRLLGPLHVRKPTRALLTLLEDANAPDESQANAAELLKLLRSPEFANRRVYTAEEIGAQIEENRNSWDRIESSAPTEIAVPEEQSRVIDEIVQGMKSNQIPEDAPHFTREELHERR